MDAVSSVSETFQDECQFLAMEHDEFLELAPMQDYMQKEEEGQSAVLVDVVTGSLFLSNSVSVSTDGPLTDRDNLAAPSGIPSTNLRPMQRVQPIFINRSHCQPAAPKPVMGMPDLSNSFNSSLPGPLAFIAVGRWLPQDSAEGFPMSPTVDVLGTNNSLNSHMSGNVLPLFRESWPIGAWPAAPIQNAGAFQHQAPTQPAGGPFSPVMARWLTTEDQNCRTPVTAAAAVAVPGAPVARRLPRPL